MVLTNLTDKHIATHIKESGISNFRIISKTKTIGITLLDELRLLLLDSDFHIVSNNEVRIYKRNATLEEMKTYEI